MRASVPTVRGCRVGAVVLAADKIVAISVAFPDYRVAADRLIDLDTTNIKRSLAETVKDVEELRWLVGGIDLSLNDDLQKGQEIAWQPQFYGFAGVSNPGKLSDVLRDKYRSTTTVPRPVHIKKSDGSAHAFPMRGKASSTAASPTSGK